MESPAGKDSMRTSDANRPIEQGQRAALGFTLLEVIVVLSIMGLVAAVVAPAAVRSIDSWRRQADADALGEQVRSLPGRARGSGTTITIDNASLSSEEPPLRMAPGWSLSVPEPWKVHANGVCDGGLLVARNGSGQERAWQVHGPFCDPQPIGG